MSKRNEILMGQCINLMASNMTTRGKDLTNGDEIKTLAECTKALFYELSKYSKIWEHVEE